MPKGSIPRSKSGKTWDYLKNRSNIGRPFRAVKGLMDDPPSLTGPIRKEDIERSFDAAGLAVGGGSLVKRPSGSIGMGGRAAKPPRPAKDVKPGSLRDKALSDAKAKAAKPSKPPVKKNEAAPRPAKDYQSNGSLRREFLDKVDKGEIKAKKIPNEKVDMGSREKLALGATAAGALGAGAMGYGAAKKSPASDRKTFADRGTSFPRGKGSPSAPKKEPSTEPKGGVAAQQSNKAAPTSGGVNTAKDKVKRQMQGQRSDYGKKASDKSSIAGKKAKQVVQGGTPKRGMTFQEATRRNRSDEYLKERLRPKKSLADLFKKKR